MATIAMRFRGLSPLVGLSFGDTRDHWRVNNINAAQAGALVTGFPDGSFRPQQTSSRAEFVTIINRMLGRGPLSGRPPPTWPDVLVSHWAIGQVEEASTNHEFERQADGEKWLKDLK